MRRDAWGSPRYLLEHLKEAMLEAVEFVDDDKGPIAEGLPGPTGICQATRQN